MAESVVKSHFDVARFFGDDRYKFYIGIDVEERAQTKHAALDRTPVVSQSRLGVEQIEFDLQKVVLANLAHFSFGFGDIIKFAGVFDVLKGAAFVFAGRQQIEEILYRRHGYFLCGADVGGFGGPVFVWLDFAFPFDVVDAEYRLIEFQSNRDRHEAIADIAAQLPHEIER